MGVSSGYLEQPAWHLLLVALSAAMLLQFPSAWSRQARSSAGLWALGWKGATTPASRKQNRKEKLWGLSRVLQHMCNVVEVIPAQLPWASQSMSLFQPF